MIKGRNHLFGVSDQLRGPSFEVSMNAEEFGFDIIQDPRFPDHFLDAPIASWVISRLAAESQHRVKTIPTRTDQQHCDGGGYVFRISVRSTDGGEIAEFQLQGDTYGVALLGSCRESHDPAEILAEFTGVLLDAPSELVACRVEVVDPEWSIDPLEFQPEPDEDTVNLYGWDGVTLLGADNIWCEYASGASRPAKYRDYLENCLSRLVASKEAQ